MLMCIRQRYAVREDHGCRDESLEIGQAAEVVDRPVVPGSVYSEYHRKGGTALGELFAPYRREIQIKPLPG